MSNQGRARPAKQTTIESHTLLEKELTMLLKRL